ncbi:hypothetical protein [Brevibacillus daliensis]|uniref:hypothetical protein n=1 Tax=Brevibacillus daliensis TaxID=2892995 RepID=UPI001E59A37B|nr:hypothetical protein [Brevibacillus daliensis]
MEKLNAKLLAATKRISMDTLRKSNEMVRKSNERAEKLANPPKRIVRIGSVVGGCIGAGLLIIGTVGFILGKTVWPISMVTVGVISIVSNIINIIRTNDK